MTTPEEPSNNTLRTAAAGCQTAPPSRRRGALCVGQLPLPPLKNNRPVITLLRMSPARIIVFLPCHSLDDFPTWLGDSEADALLAAWTAAWHPQLIATVGRMPAWASVESPPSFDIPVLAVVPGTYDDRLTGSIDSSATPGTRWVRRAGDRQSTVKAALAAVGLLAESISTRSEASASEGRTVSEADFYSLGLAWLLSELLAKRMRSSTGIGSASPYHGGPGDEVASGFEERVVAAARACVAGDAVACEEALRDCFGQLEAARARYYAVDVWLIDLVLLAETTLGARLAAELDSPVPLGLVATGRLVESLSKSDPNLLGRLREACQAGRVAPAGGRYEEIPLDSCLPETIRESFLQGHRAWRSAVGRVPTTFAQFTGGWSALLPAILVHFNYSGVIWNLFDGTPLPDPGTGRIRWEGSGGASVDGIARPPLDARRSATILSLADRIGDALDHDHTAVVQFAHHAGTASQWFDDLRRIGGWTTALGTFVTPDELFRRTAGSGTLVSYEPDSYPVSRPALREEGATSDQSNPLADPIGPRIEAARGEARRIVAGRKVVASLSQSQSKGPGRGPGLAVTTAPPAAGTQQSALRSVSRVRPGGLLGGLARGLFGSGADDRLVLEHDTLRVRVHPVTGGLLSVRRPADRGNQLSQHLALRTTRPAPPVGAAWEDPLERAEYAQATADSVERISPTTILSRGTIRDPKGLQMGNFTQRVELIPGLPLARIEIDVSLASPSSGASLENHLACRFAWNENDDIELRRSLQSQSIATERTLFTAPHSITLCHGGKSATETDITILTGGLPWHVRSSPHVIDSLLLAGDGVRGTFCLAVGVGLARPWNLALDLLASGVIDATPPTPRGPTTASGNVRLTWQGPVLDGGRAVGVRVGLLESEGRSGDVTVDWGFEVAAARVCDAVGRPVTGPEISVNGQTTTTHLRRYGWLLIDLLYAGAPLPADWAPAATPTT